MQFPDSDFWNFSMRFYSLPEVEKTCLHLQNSFELDVNGILFIYWLVSKHQAILSADQWSQIISISLPWQEIIKPLRKSRQLIKDSTIAWPSEFQQETKSSIGQIEIKAEHMQQLAMEKLLPESELISSDANVAQLVMTNFSNMLNASNNGITTDMIDEEIDLLTSLLPDDQENKKIMA